jgi:peptidoglycan biosynthesis protein MviN/MurJ (putative lipid II flippase)
VIAGLPALCVLVVFARPIAGTLAAGDLWNNALIASLTVCIAVLAVAQLAAGVHEIGRQALYAQLDVRSPRLAGILAFTVTAAWGGAALLLPAGLPRLAGLACAVLVADIAAASAVVGLLRRSIRPEPMVAAGDLGTAALAAAAMLPVLAGGWVLSRDDGDAIRDVVVMGTTAALGAAVFALVLAALNRRRPPA